MPHSKSEVINSFMNYGDHKNAESVAWEIHRPLRDFDISHYD